MNGDSRLRRRDGESRWTGIRDTERVSEPRFFGLDHCLSKTNASRPRIIELLVDRVSPNGVTGQVSTDFHPSGIKSVPHRSGSVYQESS